MKSIKISNLEPGDKVTIKKTKVTKDFDGMEIADASELSWLVPYKGKEIEIEKINQKSKYPITDINNSHWSLAEVKLTAGVTRNGKKYKLIR